jgi:PAS domain S-box-containing protein
MEEGPTEDRDNNAFMPNGGKMSPVKVFYQDAGTECVWMPQLQNQPNQIREEDGMEPDIENSEQIDAIKRKVIRTGIGSRVEAKIATPDGPHYYDVMIEPRHDSKGSVAGVMGYVRDITDRWRIEEKLQRTYEQLELRAKERTAELEKAYEALQQEMIERRRAEETVRESQARYIDLYENATDMIFTIDPEGVFTSVNRAVSTIFGHDFASAQRKSVADILTAKSARTARFLIQKALKLKSDLLEEQPWEFEAINANGGTTCLEVRARLIWSNDTITGMQCVARDITERKQVEEELSRLAKAVEQAAEIVVVTDKYGKIQYVNTAFCNITGYAKEEVVGRSLTFFAGRKEDERTYKQMFDGLGSGVGSIGRVTNKKKDGSTYQAETSVSPVRDRTGKTINYVVVERDVTEEIRLEMQLRQAQKMEAIGTLAGGIAHDFNNILSAIIGFAEMSIEDLPESDTSRYFSEQILKAAIRGRDLIRQILTFSHKREQERAPVRFSSIIKEARKFLRASLPSTIEIRLMVEDESSMIVASPTEMHQVLMNLCTNAAHAMRQKGGILDISLQEVSPENLYSPQFDIRNGACVKLSISDTGTGMTKEVMERIFDPFFTTKGPGEGTGMGLSVVHGIVKSHGGIVAVRSTPGKGSTFDLYFPKADGAQSGAVECEREVPGGHECILLVDDEESIVEMERGLLERMGYEVVSTADSLEALEVFKREPERFDVIITDQTMPHVTGADLSRECIGIRPDIPVILCSGFSEILTAEAAQKLGIREFLMKPIVRRELALTVRRVLDGEQDGV